MRFKGIFVPDVFIEILGTRLATKLSAYHASQIFRDSNISDMHPLDIYDVTKLIELKICEYQTLGIDEVVTILKSKTPQSIFLNLSLETCSWCKCLTAELHAHHYPISKKLGGKKTISICPNCHCEFHRLADREVFQIKMEHRITLDHFYREACDE